MAINAIQAAIRSMTGTERQFNGDLHAHWDQLGIPPGQFAERMVVWKQLPQNAAWIAATEDADAAEVADGLWKNGEQGVWYDASDISTMYQDAAGTLPVYMPGGGQVDPPVGRILDKSGRGNHAFQTTTTSRPTLSARYNLLTATENLTSAFWSKAGVTEGGADYITESSTSEGHYAKQTVSALPAGTKLRGRAEFKLRTGVRNAILRFAGGSGSAYTIVDLSSGAVLITSVTGSTWSWAETPTVKLTEAGDYSVTGVVTTNEPSGALALWVGMTPGTSLSYLGDGVSSVYVRSADLRISNDGAGLPPYQRVVDANTYDTAGFPLYLRFDGVDDFLQTANVDFSGTDKLFASAALRKLSDAATGMLLELSPTLGSNSGTFYIAAPGAANTGNVKLATKGTTEVNVATGASAFRSPVSVVASAIMDIAAQLSTLRVNGAVAQTSSSSLGTGALGNYPIYIGRRAGTSLPFNGRLYSLLVRGAITPDAQIAKVERYLNSKARAY